MKDKMLTKYLYPANNNKLFETLKSLSQSKRLQAKGFSIPKYLCKNKFHFNNTSFINAMHTSLLNLCIKKIEKFFALVKTLFNIVMGIAFPLLTNPST